MVKVRYLWFCAAYAGTWIAAECWRAWGCAGCIVMTDGNREAFYRDKAEELRQLAEQMRFEDCRGQLEKIAQGFELLAARLARRTERDAAD
jgi:hypothetical protein